LFHTVGLGVTKISLQESSTQKKSFLWTGLLQKTTRESFSGEAQLSTLSLQRSFGGEIPDVSSGRHTVGVTVGKGSGSYSARKSISTWSSNETVYNEHDSADVSISSLYYSFGFYPTGGGVKIEYMSVTFALPDGSEAPSGHGILFVKVLLNFGGGAAAGGSSSGEGPSTSPVNQDRSALAPDQFPADR
jgi:hypothetical protein